ncbi:methylmalonyl Co-A mutase-associated GTPase MeaB [Pedobacter glucosidilyticus]|uniref:methylmalonyl Co-A mutase-associated GTPase MeaB n=1 Tax=Pedobacter glucosidilyticus TaxID=1122941 RepID=UPI000479EE4F|nr:methylmalonyl Co-A mutase-associated GTPase MeaB [Pedobacter glucosidilyticus]
MLDKAKTLLASMTSGDVKSLARALTIVENDLAGADDILKSLHLHQTPVIGVTGPPGAGKSTLLNSLIGHLTEKGKRIAILAVDPTSPFSFGSLLGDRIRMKDQFNHPNVFIRSLATRGALGGLSGKTIEMTDVLKAAHFDFIFVETVGVGQSEVEIAGLADLTMVVLVPESGDEIQHIKSGLMEIADIFIVNKSDRPDAQLFTIGLQKLIREKHQQIKVFNTVADKGTGVIELANEILAFKPQDGFKKIELLTQKAWQLIQHYQMRAIQKNKLQQSITEAYHPHFNIYQFIETFMRSS